MAPPASGQSGHSTVSTATDPDSAVAFPSHPIPSPSSQAIPPAWLDRPEDFSEIDSAIFSQGAARDGDGVLTIAGRRTTDLVEQWGSPALFLDEADFRQRAEAFRTAFAGWSISYAGKAFLCGGMARWAEQEGLGL
ncbi:MAG: hypothetical protein LBM23_07365, partial [Propionibacteriaceae bacterium]|nr:hypothetical protein [Propionibacteriaceae bacterium]